MSKVFIAFQLNEDTRPIIEAVMADNPHCTVANRQSPAMVKIDAAGSLVCPVARRSRN
jgi:phenol hydroxylase P2 protein